jgi:hypothetical protein
MRDSETEVPMGIGEELLWRTLSKLKLQERKLSMCTMTQRLFAMAVLGLVVLISPGRIHAQQTVPVIIPQPMPEGVTQNTGSAPIIPGPVVVQNLPAVPAAQAGTPSSSMPLSASRNIPAQAVSGGSACNGGSGTALGVGKAPIQFGQYGRQCANGCGSWAGNCGFIFGSCRSFFDPCGPLPLGCKKCPVSPFGHPYGTGINRCTYDSYLNH